MLQQLNDILNGKEDNYILPFYWQQGNHYDKIPQQIQAIYDSGARAFCVESRTHCDFAGPIWWKDMDLMLSEAKKRDMKVWILDDDHFPTGHANGWIKNKYPELRKWLFVEEHMDVVGPMKNMSLLINKGNDTDDILLGAYAYQRDRKGQEITGEPIEITNNIHGDFLYWDVPDGAWRVFFYYKSRRGGRADYIDLVSAESVDVLIKAVYEPHYEHYKEYFGNTLAGFFSDEPSLGNGYAGAHYGDKGMYDTTIGLQGLALPYHDEILPAMTKETGRNALAYLAALWFPYNAEKNLTQEMRYAYMDAMTKLYSKNFAGRLGNWCRAHGCEYIGHIIEDMNAHARMGCSAGHFFRAMEGQDMSGMDIVLHQVMPGMRGMIHTATNCGNNTDPDFFHNVLAEMCGSMAQLYPQMKGRAMCEVFGAFGWAEGAPFMKWLMDFLLVRGVNHFVPHAFSPVYPNDDCPPHFGAEGHDPQFDGFTAIMKYSNKVSHLLCGADHVCDCAIFYHGEAEWANLAGNAMTMNRPASVLSDNGISYEIVPFDVLAGNAGKFDKKRYRAIIVPTSEMLPEKVMNALKNCGTRIIFVDHKPADCDFGEAVTLNDLPSVIAKNVSISTYEPDLRYYLCKRGDTNILMFFNGGIFRSVDTEVTLPFGGAYCKLDLLNDHVRGGHLNGKLHLTLAPYQSVIYVFDGCEHGDDDKEPICEKIPVKTVYRVEKADSENLSDYRFYTETDTLFNMNAPDHDINFAGS